MGASRPAGVLVTFVLAGCVLAACASPAGPGTSQPPSQPSSQPPSPSSQPARTPTGAAADPSPGGAADGTTGGPSAGAGRGAARAAACAARVVAAMPLQRRAAQLLVVGVPADASSPPGAAAGAVRDLGVGGVILTGRSERGVAATRALVRDVRSLAARGSPVPLVAVDQEGGAVQVLGGPGFSDIPRPRDQARSGAAELRERAAGWGAELAAAGVDLDLAPVAGVVPPGRDNAPIGRFGRGYGDSPRDAAPLVAAFVAGMGRAGVATAVKHFPGLGRATGNTDDTASVVDDVTTVDDAALQPFRAAVAAGAGYVMMSSATYTRIDPERPALFSPRVVALARSASDFGGVVMSDDVGAATALADVPVGERATRFVAAGGDLVLTVRPQDAPEMVDALVERAGDRRFAARVEQAATRLVSAKVDAGLVDCGG